MMRVAAEAARLVSLRRSNSIAVDVQNQSGANRNRERRLLAAQRDGESREARDQIEPRAAAPILDGAQHRGHAQKSELKVKSGRHPRRRIGEARHQQEQDRSGQSAIRPEERNGVIEQASGRRRQQHIDEMGSQRLQGNPERGRNEDRPEEPEEGRSDEISEPERPGIVVAGDPVLPIELVVAVEAGNRDQKNIRNQSDRGNGQDRFP